MPTDDGDYIPPEFDATNPWEDPNFDNTGWGSYEWEIATNWGYYNQIYQEATTRPNNPARYYITVGGTYYRFYNNDTIAVPQSDSTVLVIHNEISPYTVGCNGTTWRENDTVRTMEMKTCWMMTSNVRISHLKVKDEIADTNLIQNKFVVYKIPLIIFEKDAPLYNSEFGFDDSSHKHSLITSDLKYKKGTEIATIQGNSYDVPWMSLLDGQNANIKVTKVNLDPNAAKDPAFSVLFRPSNSKILLNGTPSLTLNYTQLVNLSTLNVSAAEFNSVDSLKTIESIYVVTNMGDTIGKLNLSCQKPVIKKMMLVYVNTGTGYRTNLTRTQILDSLNKKSHNQFFRKWVIDSVNSAGGMDTLDATQEFSTMNAKFQDDGVLMRYMDTLFENHKGKNMVWDINNGTSSIIGNHPDKVHMVFIFNYDLPVIGGVRTDGSTQLGGYKSLIWQSAFCQTIAHELGHILRLNHVFPETINGTYRPRYGVPIGTSKNYMDYNFGVDRTNCFYFAQWVDVY